MPSPLVTPRPRLISMRLLKALVAITLCGAPALARAQTIDTRIGPPANWQAGSNVEGQAFIAPAQFFLNASLWVGSNTGTTIFRAFLAQWSGNPDLNDGTSHSGSIIGSPLFTSDERSVTGSGATQFDFNLGGLALNTGTSYVFYLAANSGNFTAYGEGFADPYLGGNAVYYPGNSGVSPTIETGYDAAFVGNFASASPVSTPEPGTLALMASGLAAVAIIGLRRRRTKAG